MYAPAKRNVLLPLVPALMVLSASISPATDATSVHPLFDLSTPERSPFPSDRFTVYDPSQNTGRRIALPMPTDCAANRSDCDDLSVLNELDGFNQHPRVSIPFDNDIDPSSVNPKTVFMISVPESGKNTPAAPTAPVEIVGLNQLVWDPASRTLHGRADKALQEHSRYALVVTRGVRDTHGRSIEAADSFRNYRSLLAISRNRQMMFYRAELIEAENAACAAGVGPSDLAVISVFHTQSSTYLARRIYDQVFSGPSPAPVDFHIGPNGSRAVYALASLASVTFNRQLTTGPNLSPTPGILESLRQVPGAIGSVAFGRYQSPNYRAQPGEHIAAIPTRTGVPVQQGTETIYFNLYLPSGPIPANGWPVAIVGHGSSLHKNFAQGTLSPYLAAHGVAFLMINTAGHGFGPRSTLQLAFTDGSSAVLPAGGRSIDQNGDGQITVNEGFQSAGAYTVRRQADGYLQTVADLMQLVRVIQSGVDADGDGRNDLDPSRVTYWGWSLGSNYGMTFFATTPEVRAAAFATIGAPTLEHARLSPIARPMVGAMLAARVPSLLNSQHGLAAIDGVAVPEPLFNENQPLRNQPVVINTVPGAIAIQQVLERYAWAGRNGDPAAFAPLVRLRPPGGQAPRPVLIQFGRGDQRHQNPGTSELLRVAELEDRAWFYRHDLFYPTMPPEYRDQSLAKDAHAFHAALMQAPWLPVVIGAHEQVSEFLASDGLITAVPQPTQYWERVIPLPEELGYLQ